MTRLRQTNGPSIDCEFRVRELTPVQLSTQDIQSWLHLETRALEFNSYLSPHFLLPALHSLDRGMHASLLIVEIVGIKQPEMMGLAAVVVKPCSRCIPLPHLGNYQSRHSFLGTPLIDREHAPEVITCLLRHFRDRPGWILGLVWDKLSFDGELIRLLHASAREQKMGWHVLGQYDRAELVPQFCSPESNKNPTDKKLKKEAARCKRRLSEQGEVDWVAYRDVVPTPVIDTFLRLEHNGWKGDQGSSLLANKDDETFFRQMVNGFASEGRAMFTELRLNGNPIASTCNFISGPEGFAFKVGWDPDYRQFGVGILNEVEFVQRAHEICKDLTRIDSGSASNSFIERIWPGRRKIGSVFITFNNISEFTFRLYAYLYSFAAACVRKTKMRNK
ncbi:MAG: GNAT family N-acetyltransferase [Desulfosporosinus sp.]|nr:GNAT family N-acetyltransferase [Desulfosporosinus sp.]